MSIVAKTGEVTVNMARKRNKNLGTYVSKQM